jgi:hypothetical protein
MAGSLPAPDKEARIISRREFFQKSAATLIVTTQRRSARVDVKNYFIEPNWDLTVKSVAYLKALNV